MTGAVFMMYLLSEDNHIRLMKNHKRCFTRKSPTMTIPMANLPATPKANPTTVPNPALLA